MSYSVAAEKTPKQVSLNNINCLICQFESVMGNLKLKFILLFLTGLFYLVVLSFREGKAPTGRALGSLESGAHEKSVSLVWKADKLLIMNLSRLQLSTV